MKLAHTLGLTLVLIASSVAAAASADSGECSGGAAWVPAGSPFGGFMACPGECDERTPCDTQINPDPLDPDRFYAFCACDDGSQGEPSGCCSLVMLGDLSTGMLVPRALGSCGNECGPPGTCKLYGQAIEVNDPKTHQWDLLGYQYGYQYIVKCE